ncbi:unnamed protein product, partial [Mesorhabditis spiculigera]
MPVLYLLIVLIAPVSGQINLGTFNLGRDPYGQWNLGFNQGANLFGFGGDRGIALSGGDRGFGMQTNGGALVGGERVGVDSGLGVDKQNGLGLGSLLSFGNQPANQPGGQLQQFLQNIGRFFSGIAPTPAAAPAGPLGREVSSSGGPLGTIGVASRPAPNMPQQPDTSSESAGEASFPTLAPDTLSGDREPPSIQANIDEAHNSVETVDRRPTNPRRLPGLVDMNEN